MPASDRLTLYFDGGARPNPGRMEAAVVVRGQARFRDDLGIGDNSAAEWLALLFALDIAIALGAQDVLLLGDSTLVIEQASARQRCRSAHLLPYLEIFRRLAGRIPRLHLRHVARSKNLAGIALARRRDGLRG